MPLSRLQNLKYLTYASQSKDFVLCHAVHQLGEVASLCGLVEVQFDIILEGDEEELDQGLCGKVDKLLIGNKFPSLSGVFLHRTIPVKLFPELEKRGLIRVIPSYESFWRYLEKR